MLNLYKENFYNVGDLISVLQTVPKDYEIEIYSVDFDAICGRVSDIDIDHETKKVCLWFE